MSAPWTFGEAHDTSEEARRAQEDAEENLRVKGREFAAAELAYRVALAAEMKVLRLSGVAWTVTGDLARGAEHVAELRKARDEAETDKDVAVQAGWRRTADRKDTLSFIGWSQRRDLAEDPPPPAERDMPVFGARG